VNVVPVNTSAIDFVAVEVVAKSDMNGVQRRNAANVPQWAVRALCIQPDQKPTVLEVTIAQESMPEVAPMASVMFEDLICRPWQQGDRSGIAFSASMVRPSGKRAAAPAPAPNASEPKSAA
jgi:hypothetical protein